MSCKLPIHHRPKELPQGCEITRTLAIGIPSPLAMASRISEGVCVLVHTVTRSPSHCAVQALRPIGAYAWLSNAILDSTTLHQQR